MPNKKRKQKVSAGTAVGSRSVVLSELQKVLMGKGIIDSFRFFTPPKEVDKHNSR